MVYFTAPKLPGTKPELWIVLGRFLAGVGYGLDGAIIGKFLSFTVSYLSYVFGYFHQIYGAKNSLLHKLRLATLAFQISYQNRKNFNHRGAEIKTNKICFSEISS